MVCVHTGSPLRELEDSARAALAAHAQSTERSRRVAQLVALYHMGITTERPLATAPRNWTAMWHMACATLSMDSALHKTCEGAAASRSDKEMRRLYLRAGQIIFHSLYFPAVAHWMNVLGRANVMVVKGEDLVSPSRLMTSQSRGPNFDVDQWKMMKLREIEQVEDRWARVFAHIGLCPMNMTSRSHYENKTPPIEGAARLTNASMTMLRDYFQPFNDLLEQMMGQTFYSDLTQFKRSLSE